MRSNRRDEWNRKRMSRSFDEDSPMLAAVDTTQQPSRILPLPLDVLMESESMNR